MKTLKELLMGLSEAKKKKMKGEDPCWDNYEMVGTKKKNGREVPNCVPKNEEVEIYEAKVGDTVSFHHELKAAPGTKMKKSGTVEKVQGDDVLVKVKDKYGVKRHQVKMSDLVKEDFGADFLAMARQKNPNARLVTPDQKKKEAEELAKKRAGLKPAHAAPTGNSRPLGGYDPKSNRSYSEDVEGVEDRDQINEMNPMLVRDGLQVVIDFLSQYPQATALTAGAAGAAIVAKLVKNAWKNHKELEQLKQDVRNWNTQKLHSNKNVSAKGGKVAKIIQTEIERRKQGVVEGVEQVDELNKDTVYSYNKKSTADTEKLHKKLGEFIRKNKSAEANKTAHKLNKRVAGQERADARLNTEEAKVETAAQVTKHFEMGQSTPSGVPKWVAEPLKKKKKKVEEAGDPELMGGAVSKPTASGNNPKLADKFMKAFRKMKSPANISCKTVGMISTCEDTSLEEEKKKKQENTSDKDIGKGEKLSGKQEPVNVNPELKEK